MRHILAPAALLFVLLGPAPAAAETPCATAEDLIPDYTLVDGNPNSATYGTEYHRDDLVGHVGMIYWAVPSCAHCQAQVRDLQALYDANSATWGDVSVVIIAISGYEEYLPDLVGDDEVRLPVLLDTAAVDARTKYGADKWYIYLMDRSGRPKTIHYELDLVNDADRLLSELALLVGEAK